MRTSGYTLIVVICSVLLIAFYLLSPDTKENGYLYENETLEQLREISDDLHHEFNKHPGKNIYYSRYQSQGHYISLDTGNVHQAIQDIESGISFEQFIQKYPLATVKTDILITKNNKKYQNEKEDKLFFSGFGMEYIEPIKDECNDRLNVKDGWIYETMEWNARANKVDYYNKLLRSQYPPTLSAFFFLEDLKRKEIPEKYAHMIRYTDFMVDTSAYVFSPDFRDSRKAEREMIEISKAYSDFTYVLDARTFELREAWEKSDSLGDYYSQKYEEALEDLVTSDEVGKLLFDTWVRESLERKYPMTFYLPYLKKTHSKEIVLEVLRATKSTPTCGFSRPDYGYVIQIAILAAQTEQWPIFIRAHLDILNKKWMEKLEQDTSSYIKYTYIRELEAINLNIPHLITGMSLKVDNPAQNHYSGNLYALGPIMEESSFSQDIENLLIEMIGDKELDDYNRSRASLLYLNLLFQWDEKELSEASKNRFRVAIQSLPEYLTLTFEAIERKKPLGLGDYLGAKEKTSSPPMRGWSEVL